MAVGSIGILNLVLAIILMSESGVVVWAQPDCLDDVNALDQCQAYFTIRGPEVPPSEACCGAVRAAHIPCVCQYVSPKALDVISVKKVAYVAGACGRPLPHGYICGSLTIP